MAEAILTTVEHLWTPPWTTSPIARLAAASRFAAYQPGGAFNPFLALLVDTDLGDDYHLNFYLRHKWLASAMHDSPLVGNRGMDTAFIGVSYRFK